MKSMMNFLMAAIVLPGAMVYGEEAKKEESQNGQTHIQLGPISVAVSVASSAEESKKRAYLGVVTSALFPQLRTQLDLPEGMGLGVDAVAKDSPAEKAGLKQYDVLKKFNDQMLCAQEQLSALVTAAGKGTKATLVIIRGGKEQNMEVTLGERAGPEPYKTSFSLNGLPGIAVQLQELENQLKNATPESGGIQDRLKNLPEEIQKRVEESVRRAQESARQHGARPLPDGGARVFSFYPEEHGSTHYVVVITDGDGSLELTKNNGLRTVTIRDAQGAEIFSRIIKNEADLTAMPDKFRAKLKDAEDRIKSATPDPKKFELKPQEHFPDKSKQNEQHKIAPELTPSSPKPA